MRDQVDRKAENVNTLKVRKIFIENSDASVIQG